MFTNVSNNCRNDYEELDKYEKQEQDQDQEENVYFILDGPTMVEEPGGVASSTDIVPEEQKMPILSTDVSN